MLLLEAPWFVAAGANAVTEATRVVKAKTDFMVEIYIILLVDSLISSYLIGLFAVNRSLIVVVAELC